MSPAPLLRSAGVAAIAIAACVSCTMLTGVSASAKSAKQPETSGETSTKSAQPTEPPTGWSESEKTAALKACLKTLATVRATIGEVTAIRNGECGDPAMVTLSEIE
ncbi:MAG: hypothetical protein AAFR23_10880, partial [Pseudomonadota bacterium]